MSLQPLSPNDPHQIQYLLGNPPSWMLRYGITVIAGALGLLLGLSYCVHYPDVVEAPVVLTTAHPPIRVMAPASGRVVELLVTDGEAVVAGQVLSVIANTARWRDVLALEDWLNAPAGALPEHLHLGELQPDYSAFSQHWKDRDYYLRHNGVAARSEYLQKQIAGLEKMELNLQQQASTMQAAVGLAAKELQRQQQLYRDKIIAEKEWETSEAQWLTQKRQLDNAEAAILQNQMQIKQLEGQLNDLRQGKSDAQHEKMLAVSEDAWRLRSALEHWKQTYLVMAPISGRVSLTTVWSPQQFVGANQEILAVIPKTIPFRQEMSGQVRIITENRRVIARLFDRLRDLLCN